MPITPSPSKAKVAGSGMVVVMMPLSFVNLTLPLKLLFT